MKLAQTVLCRIEPKFEGIRVATDELDKVDAADIQYRIEKATAEAILAVSNVLVAHQDQIQKFSKELSRKQATIRELEEQLSGAETKRVMMDKEITDAKKERDDFMASYRASQTTVDLQERQIKQLKKEIQIARQDKMSDCW